MSDAFKAFRIRRAADGEISAAFERSTLDDLTPGDVVIRVEYSSINYKDALAATGAGAILRRFPLIAGIDLAGTVVESSDARFAPGQPVLVCGGGIGERLDGGYSEIARVPAALCEPIPEGLDARNAMAIGTAGVTAALALHRLERNGQTPDLGPLVVTGATGGVGSFCVDLFSKRGYEVVAVSGKADRHDYLRALGAASVETPDRFGPSDRPLGPATWGGAVDTVGAHVLAALLRSTKPNGSVASIGLAAGHRLDTTVMPFILRGVSLIGVNAVEIEPALRAELWRRLADDLRPRHLDRIAAHEVPFDDLPGAFRAFLERGVVGRIVVRIR